MICRIRVKCTLCLDLVTLVLFTRAEFGAPDGVALVPDGVALVQP